MTSENEVMAKADERWVFGFDEIEAAEKAVGGDWDDVRSLLGGKGANLAEMTRIGIPVPPGFTVTDPSVQSVPPSRRCVPR